MIAAAQFCSLMPREQIAFGQNISRTNEVHWLAPIERSYRALWSQQV
jgi:hypothetical protein